MRVHPHRPPTRCAERAAAQIRVVRRDAARHNGDPRFQPQPTRLAKSSHAQAARTPRTAL